MVLLLCLLPRCGSVEKKDLKAFAKRVEENVVQNKCKLIDQALNKKFSS